MASKEWREVLKEAERQGWRVQETKKGWFAFLQAKAPSPSTEPPRTGGHFRTRSAR